MINIAELLKDAPKGMKLYSPLFGEVEFAEVMDTDYVPIRVMKRGYGLRFDKYGRYMGNEYPDSECLLFPSKDCRTWEGWTVPVEPNFKVEDWICPINGKKSKQVRVIEVRGFSYLTEDRFGILWPISFSAQDEWRLWTIQDAKDGDVLATNSIICIFKKLDKDGYYIISPCIYTVKGGLEVIDAEDDSIGSCGFKPATKEDRWLLFRKMKEAGYEWDAEKKELRKIQLHYDIANFHEGMPVLVREYDTCVWQWVLYSHFNGVGLFFAAGKTWRQCIPYNDDTKHLLGTTDMCDKRFINW